MAAWWLAAAFGVSWVGDSLAWLLGGSWAAVYVWFPAQLALAFLATVEEGVERLGGLFVVGVLAVLSVAWSYPGPEVLSVTVGSAALLLLARGPVRGPVRVYFGVGTVCYLAWVLDGWALGWWWAYQGCRLAACAWLAAIVLRRTHD